MNFLTKPTYDAVVAAQPAQMGRAVNEPAQGAIPPAPKVSAAEQDRLDRMARESGYRNYEEMRLFLLRRQMQSGGTVQGQKKPSMEAAMAWHPRSLLGYVDDRIRKAIGQ